MARKRFELDDHGVFRVFLKIAGIPLIGKALALLLLTPLLFIIPMLLMVDDLESEGETEATIVSVNGTGRLARKVEYKYDVEGQNYTGELKWVNLDERPEIKTGAKIRVYYLVEAPIFSRDSSEPTTKGMIYIMAAVCAGGWGMLFLVSLIWKYHYRQSKLPKLEQSGPIQRNR